MRQPTDPTAPSDLVGRRVVVRYRLHGQEFGATDVLGTVSSWSDGVVRVRRDRGGGSVEIAEPDVIAVKAVPGRAVTRRDVRDLEAAALLGWQALETEWIGAWLLRAAGGFTGRANSCMPLDDPDIPIASAVDLVERWYRERGLVPAFQVPEPLGAVLGAHLDARGWPPPEDRTIVMTASLDDVRAAARPELPPVSIDARPGAGWLDSYHYRGGDLPDGAIDVLVNAEMVGFASVYESGGVDGVDDGGGRGADSAADARSVDGGADDGSGGLVAIARGAVSQAPSGRRWLGVTAVEVAPRARRRGLGTHIVAGLASWAAEHGAHDVYLQVAEPNTVAQAAYRKVGFTDHHLYHYRRLRTRS